MRREMRLCLYPFSRYKSSGPYKHEKSGRWHINLLTLNGTSKHLNMTYARYLVSVKEGRIPNAGEEVDHIDGDRTNDVIGNLRFIDKGENSQKAKKEEGYQPRKGIFQYTCSLCSKTFLLTKKNAPHLKGSRRAFCSRECSYQGRGCPEGLNYITVFLGSKKIHKDKHEDWKSYSSSIKPESIFLSSNVLEDRKKFIDKVVRSKGRYERNCPLCNTLYTPTNTRQKCCSRGCSNNLLSAAKGILHTSEEDLANSLNRILTGASSWVTEAKKYNMSDNTLRNRMRRAGKSW